MSIPTARTTFQKVPWAAPTNRPILLPRLEQPRQLTDGNRRTLVVGRGLGDDAALSAQHGLTVTVFDISPHAISPHMRWPGAAAGASRPPRWTIRWPTCFSCPARKPGPSTWSWTPSRSSRSHRPDTRTPSRPSPAASRRAAPASLSALAAKLMSQPMDRPGHFRTPSWTTSASTASSKPA